MSTFDTAELSASVEMINAPVGFFKQAFFNGVPELFDTLEVEIQKRVRKRRISPLVYPTAQAQVVQGRGFESEYTRPAYVKDLRVVQPRSGLTRTFGEALGENLTPMQRMEMALDDELVDQKAMWELFCEWMCAEILVKGTVTLTSPLYPSVTVNFQRKAALNPVPLVTGTQWGAAGVSIEDYLQDASELLNTEGEVDPRDVVLGTDAWKAFRANANVQKVLDIRNAQQAPFNLDNQIGQGGVFKGEIFGYRIWVYLGKYINPVSGLLEDIFPKKGCLITSADALQGYAAFGAIQNAEVMEAKPFHVDRYIPKNPSAWHQLFESAPIMLPGWVDGAFYQQVRA